MSTISSRSDVSESDQIIMDLFQEMVKELTRLNDQLEDVNTNLLDMLDTMVQFIDLKS